MDKEKMTVEELAVLVSSNGQNALRLSLAISWEFLEEFSQVKLSVYSEMAGACIHESTLKAEFISLEIQSEIHIFFADFLEKYDQSSKSRGVIIDLGNRKTYFAEKKGNEGQGCNFNHIYYPDIEEWKKFACVPETFEGIFLAEVLENVRKKIFSIARHGFGPKELRILAPEYFIRKMRAACNINMPDLNFYGVEIIAGYEDKIVVFVPFHAPETHLVVEILKTDGKNES